MDLQTKISSLCHVFLIANFNNSLIGNLQLSNHILCYINSGVQSNSKGDFCPGNIRLSVSLVAINYLANGLIIFKMPLIA